MSEQVDDVRVEDDAKQDKPEPKEDNLRGELERRKEAQRKAEKELEDLRNKILEFEDRDKTELQRAQERAARAEGLIEQLSGKITSLEKGSWVRSAAAELEFHDPEDAVVNLQNELPSFEDQRDAKRAVERLAKSKQHLTRKGQKRDERPSIGRVLAEGQPTAMQVAQMNPQQAQQVRTAQRELEFAEGLSKQLGAFREQWQTFGGS